MNNLQVDITTGFYQSDSVPFANQRCINLFPNIPQTQAVSNGALFNVEGLRQVLITSGRASGANRGGVEFQGNAFFVNGDILYQVTKETLVTGDEKFNLNEIGFIGGTGRVSIAKSSTELFIINGSGDGYVYKPPSLSKVTDAGFTANGTPLRVTHIDRYFIVTTSDDKAIISAVGDGLNWNAIDFVSAEADPDGVVAPFVHENQLYLLGETTTEQYQNIGGAGVPFRRVNGFVLSTGCSAPNSIINVGNIVYWLGRGKNEKPRIYAFDGQQPQAVSTIAIDNKLHELTEAQVVDVFSFAYTQNGNTFIHFSTPNDTFVFNPLNGKWHERQSEIPVENRKRLTERCRISSVVNVFNDLLVGDLKDGRIGIIDDKRFTEYGNVMISEFTTAPLTNISNEYSIPSIELVCETGVGTPSCPEPKVRMSLANDGVLFDNPRTRDLGASGARKTRAVWYKNGRIEKNAVLKFTISDPVRRRLYSVDLQVKGGI